MTTPQIINISSEEQYEECKNKCDLSFKYPISGCLATNTGGSIGISYDKSETPPVIFNNVKYFVVENEIQLYTPSIHLFNGSYTDSELVIMHKSETSNKILYICIPISYTKVVGSATSIISQIIKSVSQNAPNAWQKTTVNLPNFSLQHIIPNKPFYSFTDSNSNNVVVYGVENAIGLDLNSIKTLTSLLQPSIGNAYFSFCTGNPAIYKNPYGPNNAQDDQIYIDCQPVNESEEQIETKITDRKPEIKYDTGDWIKMILNSILFQCFIVVMLLMLVLYGVKYLATAISKNN